MPTLRRTRARARAALVDDFVNRHFAALTAALLAVGVGGLVGVAHVSIGGQLRAERERTARDTAVVLAHAVFEPALGTDADRLTRTELARMDAAAAGARRTQTIVGLTVLAADGLVLYAPNHGLIGDTVPLDGVESAALRGRVTTVLSRSATAITDTSKLSRINVYVPLTIGAHARALFAISLPYAPIQSAVVGDTLHVDLLLLAVGSIVLALAGLRLRHAGAALRTVAVLQHRTLEHELRRAIAERQLRLEYQPLAELRTGRVYAVEALVRWDHPRRGPVPPGDFIPQAVQTKTIWSLTEHLVGEAIAQVARWRAQGIDLAVTVNLPAPCLIDERLPGLLADMLMRARLPPARLGIEITEDSAIRDPQAAARALSRLRALGIEMLLLDDFGTGYSSLTRLRGLPVTGLKLDRGFLVDAAAHADYALIAAVAELAHDLGLRVVAEGVEDGATWTRMAALGCDAGQGYWLSRPLRPQALPAWLRSRRTALLPEPAAGASVKAPPVPSSGRS